MLLQNASGPVTGEFSITGEGRTTAPLAWGATGADRQGARAGTMDASAIGMTVLLEGDVLRGFNYSLTFGGWVQFHLPVTPALNQVKVGE